MTRTLAFALVLLIALVVAGFADEPGRHVVMVSIDGLRPEFYLDPTYPAPSLRALAARGSQARAAEPVFPSSTYPDHAAIVTGVLPAKHGVSFNTIFEPTGDRGRWYEEAADLKSPPLWDWARAAGMSTAAVSWPSTLGARIDWLVPERDYYARKEALDLLRQASTPGLFDKTGVAPHPGIFKNVDEWDEFLANTAAALIRDAKPRLLLLHLAQLDFVQHRGGREGGLVKPSLARIDTHVANLERALSEAGLSRRGVLIVTGDHGFANVTATDFPNGVLARAGLRGCPKAGDGWRATAHIAGGSAGIFVNPPNDPGAMKAAETALAAEATDRYTIVDRARLDQLGAMPGAAFALDAMPGHMLDGRCSRSVSRRGAGGTHGYLPSHPEMATGFIAAGPGVKSGVTLDRIRLIDVAPTVGRLLGVTVPVIDGRVLTEILE